MDYTSKLLLFDVDGTIATSGQPISDLMADALRVCHLKGYDLGIVGGGTYEKICYQLGKSIGLFTHIFSECGCVYHKTHETDGTKYMIYKKNIRNHSLYSKINVLVKKCLEFLSGVDYDVTGQLIDLRTGIIYVSLIGMQANESERQVFMAADKKKFYRQRLLDELRATATELQIDDLVDILEGGSVGISIYPAEWNKSQVTEVLDDTTNYFEVHYFGDKYKLGENDYDLIHCAGIIGHVVDSVADTLELMRMF